MRNLIIGIATAVALSSVAGIANAAVYAPQQQLPGTIVSAFKNDPSSFLSQYPNGGAQLISRVRDLAASDPTTLPLLVNLLKGQLAPGQMNGIVTGLAQAARLASTADPSYANEIQTAIAASGNKDAADQFASLTGNAPIGAGAGGGGGGAGGGGSGAGGQTGSSGLLFGGSNGGSTTFGALHYATTPASVTTGSVGGTGNSVSPR